MPALWKTAHVLSAAIIFGTGLGIAFFTWFGSRAAIRARDIGALRLVMRYTVVADACFTAPAVAFQAASGALLVERLGWPQLSAWTAAVWALFVLAGFCWIPVLRIQVLLSRAAQGAASVEALPGSFHRLFRWWVALGVPAFAAVIAITWLMVAKPLAVS
ncbi:MAG TPA: DUF2269 domain-containing protein [Burkholderiales bacterium]|nr:DUF2269 domain-containing protein [Burkholderiales bacterium]